MKAMKRVYFTLFIVVFLLSVAACGAMTESEQPEESPNANVEAEEGSE